ncbi:MAG: phage tail protein [Pseudomonadota bacterium]
MTPALPIFNFAVEFHQVSSGSETPVRLCAARFSEVSGIEATMEPKAIRVGGQNFGEVQRVGLTKFATVILKRGITEAQDAFRWFELVAKGASSVRLRASIIQFDTAKAEVLRWTMDDALPIKFRAATYAASSGEVGVEELHFVHQKLGLAVQNG